MRYRKLTSTGDYTFGSSGQDFFTGIQAVAQAIQTRLNLLKESFWRDMDSGLPLMQEIAGTPGSQSNLAAIDATILQIIRETQGVSEIVAYSSEYNRTTRAYSYTGLVQTIYSETIPFVGTLGT